MEQRLLPLVPGQRRRALELPARLVPPAELFEQVAAGARQQVVPAQRRDVGERVDEFQPGRRAVGPGHRHGAVELDHRRRHQLGPYALQAAIGACHARARTAEDTDWPQIAALYEALVELMPSPVVELNRAVAVSRAYGPAAGLEMVDRLADVPALRGYHLLPSVRGDLLEQLGRQDEAREEFERAATLTRNEREQALLRTRAAACARRLEA